MSYEGELRNLCELHLSLQRSASDESLNCVADLRIAPAAMELGDQVYVISFLQAKLNLSFEGLSEIRGSRYGEPKRDNEVSVKFDGKDVQEKNRKGSVGGKLSFKSLMPSLSVGAEGSVSNDKSSRLERNSSGEDTFMRVRAEPNYNWKIAELYDGEVLNSSYLVEDCLIQFSTTTRANRRIVRAELSVLQRDMSIQPEAGSPLAVSDTNKRRLIDIFITKTLDASLNWGRTYTGRVRVAAFECEFDEGTDE